jgi:hypothetical protein
MEMCSLRLYDLNRRKGYFKDHALAFAEAAHELLVRSQRQDAGKRLRQYSSIYVRVTTDDEKTKKQQIDRLRELIDASVFVFTGAAPRTKTKDSNPTQQFILNFRKIYGLSAYIGLADRDRFELTDADLAEWLENPGKAKEILLRNQIKREIEKSFEHELDEIALKPDKRTQQDSQITSVPVQGKLFEAHKPVLSSQTTRERIEYKGIDLDIARLERDELTGVKIDTIFTGLGFEDRTLASNEFLAGATHPTQEYGIRYSLEGRAQEILDVWRNNGAIAKELQAEEATISLPALDGLALVDVSGLSKPFIFSAIRRELVTKGRVLICHAAAQKYYPLQEDLARFFAAEKSERPRKTSRIPCRCFKRGNRSIQPDRTFRREYRSIQKPSLVGIRLRKARKIIHTLTKGISITLRSLHQSELPPGRRLHRWQRRLRVGTDKIQEFLKLVRMILSVL